MPARSSKKKDINQTAASILRQVVVKKKHPGAVALGKLGGAKGGKARAAKLSAKRRRAIAKKAARARWSK